jgi:CBS domain-containing protein
MEVAMETVADILDSKGRNVWTVSPSTAVREAGALMREKNIGAVLVAGEDGRPVGILSERDIARGLVVHKGCVGDLAVSELMSTQVKSVDETLSIEDVMAVMTHNRIRHLPVCDEDKVVGMISIGDVVKAAILEKEFVIDQLEHYISGSL